MWLIADSGSSKTDWHFVDSDKSHKLMHTTEGINPLLHDRVHIDAVLKQVQSHFLPLKRSGYVQIHFYGAGCDGADGQRVVGDALKAHFPDAEVQVAHDLLAAARALCGDKPGLAAILGTGSNLCYYDGQQIVARQGGLGYILGDEGSGTHLGKALLRDYCYGKMPDDFRSKFEQAFQPDRKQILQDVYHHAAANRYLAGYAPFLSRHIKDNYAQALVERCFSAFFEVHVAPLAKLYDARTIHASGSVAFYFKTMFQTVAEKYKLKVGLMVQQPIDNLVAYHLNLTPNHRR